MRQMLSFLMNRSYLAGYAVLLAVTFTLAMVMAGPTVFAANPTPVKAGNEPPSGDRNGQKERIRDAMLAQATPPKDAPAAAGTSAKKPNILFIMGDDVGWFNIGAYHRGMMSGKTPNLDKLASQGMMFTDYYAEASCTAGRANFITGEIPLRTGLTTVGQAGADVGLPDQACTLATALKAQGYTTGQFGKNHLGDREYKNPLDGYNQMDLLMARGRPSGTTLDERMPRDVFLGLYTQGQLKQP